jgi:hypothetical protein
MPHTLPTIPWFQLRDNFGKLTFEQFTSPQCSVVINRVAICDPGDILLLQGSTVLVDLRSMVQIHFRILGVSNVRHENISEENHRSE